MDDTTARSQLMLLQAAQGLLPKEEIEQRARQVLDGTVEQPLPDEPRLIISDFLRPKGFEPMKRNALNFSSHLAGNYRREHGKYPPKRGKSYIYFESDRPLMESTWAQLNSEDGEE